MSLASFSGSAPGVSTRPDAIKVMVIDDAVVVRGLVGRWVGEETDMICVAAHRSARDAIADMDRRDPDVVILDIEMPDLDGITALPMLLEKKRDLVVIMASTLTRRNAEISLKCLSLGAADYVPKPESNAGVTTSPAFRRELVDKIRALGRRRRPGMRLSAGSSQPAPAPSVRMSSPSIVPAAGALSLRSFGLTMPKVLVIGASTGGPQALTTVLKGLGPIFDRAPVLITQHMPPTFTTILAEHAAKSTGRAAAEAKDGEPVVAGRIYVAPGGKHMRVKREGSAPIIQLDDGPAINFCKPAVDPLFASAAQVWGAATLALVLTGMGHDGADGAGTVVASGGSVIVQDEASSVVWGMPGATAQAGHASAVLPVDNIAAKIVRVFQGDRS